MKPSKVNKTFLTHLPKKLAWGGGEKKWGGGGSGSAGGGTDCEWDGWIEVRVMCYHDG